MDINEILNNPPKPHKDAHGGFMVMGLSEAALRFIYENVDDRSNTLETGCGLSTAVFALTGSKHTVIAPDASELDIIKSYCLSRGIETKQINFIAEPSQNVLPRLDSSPLDLVLIDGGHGFPTPYVDWFYTAGRLEKGGYLIVDDVWVWSCQILREFLLEQPQWLLVDEFEQRTAVFRKLEDGSEWLEWTQQPRVARGGLMKWIDGQLSWDNSLSSANSSALQRALNDLRNGDYKKLARKIARRVRVPIGRKRT